MLLTSEHEWRRVTRIIWPDEKATVYNIIVEGYNTYFVGKSGVLVHNVSAVTIAQMRQLVADKLIAAQNAARRLEEFNRRLQSMSPRIRDQLLSDSQSSLSRQKMAMETEARQASAEYTMSVQALEMLEVALKNGGNYRP